MSSGPRFEEYRLEIRPLSEDDGGGWLALVPDLPGCMSDGATYAEAIANAREAFDAWIAARLAENRDIPLPESGGKPARFLLRLARTQHRELVAAAATEGVSVNSLVATFVAEGLTRQRT